MKKSIRTCQDNIANPSRRLRGVLTVEAALVLSIFLLTVGSMLWYFSLLEFQTHLQCALDSVAQKAAAAMAVSEYLQGVEGEEEKSPDLKSLIQGGVSLAWISGELEEQLSSLNMALVPVQGGLAGIDLIESRLPDPENRMDLCATYTVQLPLWMSVFEFTASARSICAVWDGTVRFSDGHVSNGDAAAQDAVVYITEGGAVYHSDRNCTYINPKITSYMKGTEPQKRRCERCDHLQPAVYVYATEYGEVWHSTLECPALYHIVEAVHLSEIENIRRACSKCGGVHE